MTGAADKMPTEEKRGKNVKKINSCFRTYI